MWPQERGAFLGLFAFVDLGATAAGSLRYAARVPTRPRSALASSPESPTDRLHVAVDNLAQNVQVLSDLVNQVREDLSWLTRNGLPHQPLYVVVTQIPKDMSSEASDAFQVALAARTVNDPTAGLTEEQRESLTQQIVEQLADYLGDVAQEQLNALLSVVDQAHREVMTAIRSPESGRARRESVPGMVNDRACAPEDGFERVRPGSSDSPRPGQLF